MFKELLKLLSPGSDVPINERRDTIRLECSVAAVLKTTKKTREVRILNAGLTGLGVESESKIKKKTRVTIHRDKYGGPVSGTVMWCRAMKGSNRWQVGIAYDDDRAMLRASWIKPALKDLGFTVGRINEKRQLTRVPGHHRRCFLKNMDGDTYSAGEVINLSLGGASVSSEVEIPLGLKLLLKIDPVPSVPELVATAELVSCRRNTHTRRYVCGLKFKEVEEKLVKRHMSVMMDQC